MSAYQRPSNQLNLAALSFLVSERVGACWRGGCVGKQRQKEVKLSSSSPDCTPFAPAQETNRSVGDRPVCATSKTHGGAALLSRAYWPRRRGSARNSEASCRVDQAAELRHLWAAGQGAPEAREDSRVLGDGALTREAQAPAVSVRWQNPASSWGAPPDKQVGA